MTASAQLLALVAVVALAACNSSDFSGGSKKQPARQSDAQPTPTPAPGNTPAQEATEEFALASAQGKVDMIWVIDNSGSMTEEAAQVRENFSRFIASLQGRTDTQVALLSESDSGGSIHSTGVSLSAEDIGKGHKQIEVSVGSWNALGILASAICGAETTDSGFSMSTGPAMKICSQQPSSGIYNRIESPDQVALVRGQLNGFLRPEAKRVIVIVTDDEARVVDATNFLSLVSPALQNSTPVLFAFRGVQNRPGCDVSNRGTPYEQLASTTGGEVFDICEPDWSPNFTKLSQQVTQIANTSFTLKAVAVKAVLSVSVDGNELSADKYRLNGSTVEINRDAVPVGSQKVLVKYQY